MKKQSVILLNALPDKKAKSIGNRCMVSIKNNMNILDYHIHSIKNIFKNPEIIIIDGFDTKKIKKYISNKYKNVIFAEHDIDDYTNIGASIELGLKLITTRSCCIINSNHIIHHSLNAKIKNILDETFVLCSSNKGDVGFISDKNYILNCYYGLPQQIFDIFHINNNYIDILLSLNNLSKLYFFEIINLCISKGILIKPIQVPKKSITIINSIQNIEKIKKHYV